MDTAAVCPRLFEILTTLTFGAQRRNHIDSGKKVRVTAATLSYDMSNNCQYEATKAANGR